MHVCACKQTCRHGAHHTAGAREDFRQAAPAPNAHARSSPKCLIKTQAAGMSSPLSRRDSREMSDTLSVAAAESASACFPDRGPAAGPEPSNAAALHDKWSRVSHNGFSTEQSSSKAAAATPQRRRRLLNSVHNGEVAGAQLLQLRVRA